MSSGRRIRALCAVIVAMALLTATAIAPIRAAAFGVTDEGTPPETETGGAGDGGGASDSGTPEESDQFEGQNLLLGAPSIMAAGLSVSPSDFTLSEGEDATCTFSITGLVAAWSVTLTAKDGVSVSPSSFTLSSAGLTSKTVTISTDQDEVAQGPHTASVAYEAVRLDDTVAASGTISVNIEDDDPAAITVSPVITGAFEGGNCAYTVTLTSLPSEPVTVIPDPAAGLTVTPTSHTFTSSGSKSCTFTVDIADDDIVNGVRMLAVGHDVETDCQPYVGKTVDTVLVTVGDDDAAGIVISNADLTVSEGDTVDYTISLASQPVSPVTIAPHVTGATVTPGSIVLNSGNWSSGGTFTVHTTDDDASAGDRAATVTHDVGTSDPNYQYLTAADVDVTITDNDTPGISVDATHLIMTEGQSATYTVTLGCLPSNTLTVTPTVPTGLEITPASWLVTSSAAKSQVFTVKAIDDNLANGFRTVTIENVVDATSSPDYALETAHDVKVDISDNDTAAIEVTPTPLSVAEGKTATYTVKLTSEPAADVTITPSSGAGASVLPLSGTVTSANWSSGVIFTITAGADNIDQDWPAVTITNGVSTTDDVYEHLSASDVTVTINDDETAAIIVTPTELTVAEGDTVSYHVSLSSQPASGCSVIFTPATGLIDVPLTFTPGVVLDATNWSTGGDILVTALQNSTIDGDQWFEVPHLIASGDLAYNALTPPDVEVTVNDDDTAGIKIVETGASTDVTEGGATDTYTVALTAAPTGDVDVVISPSPAVQTGTTVLHFGTLDWNTPQAVTVFAVDDNYAEGSHTGTISHLLVSEADSHFDDVDGPTLTVNVTDNDTVGVRFSKTNLTIDEGTGGQYRVKLKSEPLSPVTVSLAIPGQLTGPASITLDAGTWNTGKLVNITALDDHILGDQNVVIGHTSTSADPQYNFTAGNVNVTIVDNDHAGVTVTGPVACAEGGASGSYTLVLTAEPSGDVTVAATPDSRVTVDPASVTFTPATWDQPRTITVSAVNDLVAEGEHLGAIAHHVSASADSYYTSSLAISSITATITDNDTAGITFSPLGLTITEGDEQPFRVFLTSQPTADVTVNLTAAGDIEVPASVTLTSVDWNTGVEVKVKAKDDWRVQGSRPATVSLAATSLDGFYEGLTSPTMAVTVNDDDAAGISLTETDGATAVTEDGATDTYTVVLTAQPDADTEVIMVPSASVQVSPSTLPFTSDNWNVPQTVTVYAVDDYIAEGNHGGTVGHTLHSVGDGDFNLTGPTLTVSITDDDIAGVNITPTSLELIEGSSNSYHISLSSQPLADVTVNITLPGELSGPASVELDEHNWSAGVDVTVASGNDAIAQGNRNVTIEHTIATLDTTYAALSDPNDVTVKIHDDDVAAVNVDALDELNPLTVFVTEGGVTDTYEVWLNSEPIAPVTVTITAKAPTEGVDPGFTVSSTTLEFSAADWATHRTVTVTAIDEGIIEGSHTGYITATVTNPDAGADYAARVGANVTVNIDDTDTIPTWPAGSKLTAGNDGLGRVNLTWTPAADNLAVTGYRIYSGDGTVLQATLDNVTATTITGLSNDTQYTFTIQARDAAGNWSGGPASGPSATIRTAKPSSGGPSYYSPPEEPTIPTFDPATGGIYQDSEPYYRLVIPAGAVTGKAPAKATVTYLNASQISSLLDDVDLPTGVDGDTAGFRIETEVTHSGGSTGLFGALNKHATFTIYLGNLPGKRDASDLALFRLNSDGSATCVGGRLVGDELIICLYELDGQYFLAHVSAEFSDTAGHWAEDEINLLSSKLILTGMPDGTFRPDARITRAEFSAILVRAMNLPASHKASFTDVSASDWFAQDVLTAADWGIIHGDPNGAFRPNDPVTRQEALVMIARALRADQRTTRASAGQSFLAAYSDRGLVAAWAADEVAFAAAEGILGPECHGLLRPTDYATRAEIAAMVARFWDR